jgi:hypothetical protein
MIITIGIVVVLLLIAVLALLIRLKGGRRRAGLGDERFRKVGPGEVRPEQKPRSTGID